MKKYNYFVSFYFNKNNSKEGLGSTVVTSYEEVKNYEMLQVLRCDIINQNQVDNVVVLYFQLLSIEEG